MLVDRAFPSLIRAAVLAAALLSASCAGGDPARPSLAASEIAVPTPASLNERLLAGHAALQGERYDAAEQAFGAVLAHDPNRAAAHLGLGEVHLARGRAQMALQSFGAAASDPLLRSQVQQGRAMALVMMRQDDAALPLIEEALASKPSLWRAWNARGLIFANRGDFTQAEASYKRALAINPAAATVENNLGFALMLQGRADTALAHFGKALALEPGLKAARNNQRLALAWGGRYTEALAGVDATELPDVLNDVGVIAMRRGDFRGAEAHFARAIETSPSYHAKAAKNLADLRARQRAGNAAATGAPARAGATITPVR
jgi:Tfp pilus assembly protein PilF